MNLEIFKKFINLSDRIKIPKMSERKNFWIFIAINSVIIIVLFLFVIYPKLADVKYLNSDIDYLKDKSTVTRDNTSLSETLTTYNEYKDKMEILESSLLSKDRELEFIMALKKIAEQHQVSQKISLGEATEVQGKFYNMPLQLWLEGDYANTINYLKNVEKLPYYININKVNVNSNKSSEESITTNMFITADTFWK